ncbi:hypothetical protein Tco_0432212 [Tanacetum coccineum]
MYPPTHPSKTQINHSSVPPSHPCQSQMIYQTSSLPQIAYNSPQPSTQPLTESPQMDSGLAVPVFNQGDDPIACLNKEMTFLTVVASSRFPLSNNQLRTSSNPRNQATFQDDRVTVQQVQGRQGQSYVGSSYQGEGHMARQCTQPKRPRNAAWFKEKAMLAEAQEAGQILDEELAFLADPDVMICVLNSTAVYDDVNVEMRSSESCVKCLDLDADLLNKQNSYNDLSKSYSQLEKHFISLELTMQLNQEIFQKESFTNNQNALEIPEYFKNNDLKA